MQTPANGHVWGPPRPKSLRIGRSCKNVMCIQVRSAEGSTTRGSRSLQRNAWECQHNVRQIINIPALQRRIMQWGSHAQKKSVCARMDCNWVSSSENHSKPHSISASSRPAETQRGYEHKEFSASHGNGDKLRNECSSVSKCCRHHL